MPGAPRPRSCGPGHGRTRSHETTRGAHKGKARDDNRRDLRTAARFVTARTADSARHDAGRDAAERGSLNGASHAARSVLTGAAYSFPSGRGRQMIAEPARASKVGQALAIGFIIFLVIVSAWELLAIWL